MNFFGTDGIRSKFNDSFLDENFSVSLGEALGDFINAKGIKGKEILLAKDTRPSGETLLRAFNQGLKNKGFTGVSAGVIPTPALALGVCEKGMTMGVMITASHNPFHDNGFKFFDSNGCKLNDSDEKLIEEFLFIKDHLSVSEAPKVINVEESYFKYITKYFSENMLKEKRIVVDLANGATINTSPRILSSLGAEVIAINNGSGKINDSAGSEFPSVLAAKVKESNADFGLAHDGDGDRVIFCNAEGKIIHGDQILGLLALHEKKMGRLQNDSLVVTIHSNSGLEASLNSKNISVNRSNVGDRRVAELMREKDACLGGESSGHVLATSILPTGDGLLTALLVARASCESNKSICELAQQIVLRPSKEGSFRVKEKVPLENCDSLNTALDEADSTLGNGGRVLLRYSGTEPKIRLLVESENFNNTKDIYYKIAKIIEELL